MTSGFKIEEFDAVTLLNVFVVKLSRIVQIPAWDSGPSEILRYFICSGSPVQYLGFKSLRTFGRED